MYLTDRAAYAILTNGGSLPYEGYLVKKPINEVKTNKVKRTLQIMNDIKNIKWGDAKC